MDVDMDMAAGGIYTENAGGTAGLKSRAGRAKKARARPSRDPPREDDRHRGQGDCSAPRAALRDTVQHGVPSPRPLPTPVVGQLSVPLAGDTWPWLLGDPLILCESTWERGTGFRAQPSLHTRGFCPSASPGQCARRGRLSQRFLRPPELSLQVAFPARSQRPGGASFSRSALAPAAGSSEAGQVPRPGRRAFDTWCHCPDQATVQRDTSWWYCAACSWGLPYT